MSLYPSLFLLGSGLVFKRLILNFFLLYCYMFLVLLCMIHQCWSFKENLCILSSKFKNFLHLWRNFPQPPDFILVCNFSSCSRVPFFSFYHFKQKCHITEVKWSDVTYGQVWWPILGICALHLTHPKCAHTQQWTHTHREHTPGAVGSHCCGAQGAVGGSVPCSRAPQSWYWGWRERWLFTPLTYNSC